MDISGTIRYIGAEQQVSATFKKRELVVSTEEQYAQHISINFVQDNVDRLDRFRAGDSVKVSINLKGREWVNPQGETKYFNDIQGWRLEALTETSGKHQPSAGESTLSNPNSSSTAPAATSFEPATNFNEEEHDDLPF
jgi:single-stranded DNA-binding protein